jgi:glutamine synthetase
MSPDPNPPNGMTPEELRQWLVANEIDEVEAIVPDMAGVARGKYMPAKKFSAERVMRLPESVFIQSVTGEYIDDWLDDSIVNPADRDMVTRPDLATLRVVPWGDEPTACVIHDCFDPDGSPVDIAPREVLRRIVALYHGLGLVPVVAPEIEFYLVKRNTDPDYPLEPPIGRSGRKETVRQPYSMDAVDEFEPFIEDIYDYCETQRLDVDNLAHEAGTAQLELNFQHGDPISLCDQMFLFKRTVRETAMRHEIYATFMAKPMEHEPGSAMHWHISLRRAADGSNAFSAADDAESELFHWFIGGLQRYLPDATLFCAPYVNSYRRFTRYLSAPINVQWGYDNRTVGLRVPQSDANNRRIENRLAGADVNPYLAIAASLACGYLGIRERLMPGPAEAGNAYKRPFELPGSLTDAILALEASAPLKALLGERFVKIYAAMKRQEHQAFFEVISPWEREYLLLKV